MQDTYKRVHDGKDSSVQANDVCFALHALAATLITCIQCICYHKGEQRISEVRAGRAAGPGVPALGVLVSQSCTRAYIEMTLGMNE